MGPNKLPTKISNTTSLRNLWGSGIGVGGHGPQAWCSPWARVPGMPGSTPIYERPHEGPRLDVARVADYKQNIKSGYLGACG